MNRLEEIRQRWQGADGASWIQKDMEFLLSELDRKDSSLRDIIAHLGTGDCTENNCQGCQWEKMSAVKIAEEGLQA